MVIVGIMFAESFCHECGNIENAINIKGHTVKPVRSSQYSQSFVFIFICNLNILFTNLTSLGRNFQIASTFRGLLNTIELRDVYLQRIYAIINSILLNNGEQTARLSLMNNSEYQYLIRLTDIAIQSKTSG